MDVVISAIVSWIVNNILNRFFFRTRKNEEIIRILEEKDQSIAKLRRKQKKGEKVTRHIIQSLKKSGLSTDKLVEKYGKPLNAILLSCFYQKRPDNTIYGEKYKFVLEELEPYDPKYLGAGVYLIPPAKVPKWIHTRNDLQIWFEKEILKGRYCKLKFLILFDMGKKAFWKSYLTYEQTRAVHFTPGELLKVEELFTEEQIKRISLSHIIRDGDIGWLAYHLLSGNEFEIIHRNQPAIESELGNPSLREFADDSIVNKLSAVLTDFGIANPDEVSKAMVEEAKFWNSRLQ